MIEQEKSEAAGNSVRLEQRLAAYLAAAGGVAGLAASHADAAVVGNSAVQPFGINGDVNIDFNSDGQTDIQIDHDRYDLNGTNLDYLQVDKNDVTSASNPTAYPVGTETFPPGASTPNDQAEIAYVNSVQGAYPSALTAGTLIGPDSTFDFQEGDNFQGTQKSIRANRLIDEDQTQIDQQVGGKTADQVYVPTDGPNFLGLGGQVRYVGIKMDLNNADPDSNGPYNYGWIGIRIDNEADATGAVVGYGYETTPGAGILAGDTGPFVANADFDDDGDVDGTDFLIWQRQTGTSVPAGTGADGDGNGQVNSADLALWKTNFATATVAAAAVPEPAALTTSLLGGVLVLCWSLLRFRRMRGLTPARR